MTQHSLYFQFLELCMGPWRDKNGHSLGTALAISSVNRAAVLINVKLMNKNQTKYTYQSVYI
jgi:hypothetical protein